MWILFLVTGDCEADLIFVLDSSASYGSLLWFIQKQFVIDIIQSLKVHIHKSHTNAHMHARTLECIHYIIEIKVNIK